MRDQKYRVWDIKNERMIYLATSQMSQIHLSINNEYWGLFDGDATTNICGNADGSGILMEFTGLKDIDGVEIYECDRVDVDYGIGHVVYNDRVGAFMIEWIDDKEATMELVNEHKRKTRICLVIGNKYQSHPVLNTEKEFDISVIPDLPYCNNCGNDDEKKMSYLPRKGFHDEYKCLNCGESFFYKFMIPNG